MGEEYSFNDPQLGAHYQWKRQEGGKRARAWLHYTGDDGKTNLVEKKGSRGHLPDECFQPQTLEVLGCFLHHPDIDLARDFIRKYVWGATGAGKSLEHCVEWIRQLLLDNNPEEVPRDRRHPNGKKYRTIETIRDYGYKFLLPVESSAPSTPSQAGEDAFHQEHENSAASSQPGKNDPIAFTATSDQKKLRRLLKSPVHAYHLTQDSAGNPAWYHKILNFDASTADGRLIAHGVNLPINATDLEGEEHRYEYEAWLDRSHLIVRTRSEDEKSPDMSIQVFPKVGDPLSRPPWWGMDAITTTWYNNPAATISIWNPEHELECARGAPDGKPIPAPEMMEALEHEWRKAAVHADMVQLPFSIRHFKTDDKAFKHLSNLYSSEKLEPKLARIRDTHARLETQPLGFGANYRENGEAFSKFLARGDEHVTRAIVILGDKWDENYVRSFLLEPVRGHEHKIEFFWLPAPILSFIILDYEDGTHEVYFGWGRLGSSPGVFASKDQEIVQAFSHYFDMLRTSAKAVPAAALENPAQLHRVDRAAAQPSPEESGVIRRATLYPQWDNDKTLFEILDGPPSNKAVIRMFVSFFVHDVELDRRLAKLLPNSNRTIEILMLNPDAEVMNLRYGEFRPDKITAETARMRLRAHLNDLEKMYRDVQKAAKRGRLRVYLYDCPPTLVSYQIDGMALIGILLLHTSANAGPMIRATDADLSLWSMIKENWNTVLAHPNTRQVIGDPVEDLKKAVWL